MNYRRLVIGDPQLYGQLMTRSEVVEKMTLIRRHLVTQIDKLLTLWRPSAFPEDEVQMDESVIQEEEEKVLKETELVKKKILAVKLVNAMLKKRLQQTIELQKTLDKILEHLDQADGVVRKEGVVDLRDSLKHCADRILGTIRIWKDLEAGDSDSAQ
nr:hypothetical protein BaRGS_019797 [Batillaria attramentaria]